MRMPKMNQEITELKAHGVTGARVMQFDTLRMMNQEVSEGLCEHGVHLSMLYTLHMVTPTLSNNRFHVLHKQP